MTSLAKSLLSVLVLAVPATALVALYDFVVASCMGAAPLAGVIRGAVLLALATHGLALLGLWKYIATATHKVALGALYGAVGVKAAAEFFAGTYLGSLPAPIVGGLVAVVAVAVTTSFARLRPTLAVIHPMVRRAPEPSSFCASDRMAA